jgi:hypothetical protein
VRQARSKRRVEPAVVYHHTSLLWTNQIWMSGVIDIEGKPRHAVHPVLGEVGPAPSLRSEVKDFPPLAWFTTRLEVPNCLVRYTLVVVDRQTGERIEHDVGGEVSHGLALNRVALGFPLIGPLIKWSEHPGYATAEGRELNATARAVGDDPNDWYVSEQPVDVLTLSKFWMSASLLEPKLERVDSQLAQIHKMVTICRTRKGVVIPPSWMTQSEGEQLAKQWGIPVAPPLTMRVH